AVTWQPIPDLKITPSVEYQNRNQHDSGTYWLALSNPDDGEFINARPDRLGDPDHFWLAAINAEYTFDGVKLVSNTSYFKRHNPGAGYSGTMYNLGAYYQNLIKPPNPVDPQYRPCPQCNSAIYPIVRPTTIYMPGFVGDYRSPARTINWQENITQEVRL